jgi:hypothetical protein
MVANPWWILIGAFKGGEEQIIFSGDFRVRGYSVGSNRAAVISTSSLHTSSSSTLKKLW